MDKETIIECAIVVLRAGTKDIGDMAAILAADKIIQLAKKDFEEERLREKEELRKELEKANLYR